MIRASTSNPIMEDYTFSNVTGLMTKQTVTRGTNTLMDLEYEYNRGSSKGTLAGTTGQLTHIKDKKDRNKDRVYEFDTLGRLIKAKGGAATGVGGVTANWTQEYDYDKYGNKLTTTNSGYTANYQAIPLDGLPSQSFDDTSNRIDETGYEYDKAGNLTRGKAPNGSWQKYEYDTAGRLRYVMDDTGWIQQSNEYASSRQRLASWSYASVDITYYAWGGSSVLAEYTTQSSSSSLTWQKSYVYAGSRLLSTITNTAGNEVTEYHHPDRLGTRLISNPVTATQDEQLTLPFGTLIGAETSATNDKRFTSYDRSEIAGGLDYAVNRNYNSGQSRFTQVDPLGMASASIGNPQSLNLFAYVQNNPIDFVDPSGLLLEGPFRGVRCSLLGYVNDQPRYLCYSADDPWYASDPGGGGFGGRGGGSSGNPDSRTDKKKNCSITTTNEGSNANGTDPVNKLSQYEHGFSVTGSVNAGKIGRVGKGVKGRLGNGEWTIGQELVGGSSFYIYSDPNDILNQSIGSVNKEGDDSPGEYSRTVKDTIFSWSDHPGFYKKDLSDDKRVLKFGSQFGMFKVYVTNERTGETCAVYFTIKSELKDGKWTSNLTWGWFRE